MKSVPTIRKRRSVAWSCKLNIKQYCDDNNIIVNILKQSIKGLACLAS